MKITVPNPFEEWSESPKNMEKEEKELDEFYYNEVEKFRILKLKEWNEFIKNLTETIQNRQIHP